jgi:hypothetical protein
MKLFKQFAVALIHGVLIWFVVPLAFLAQGLALGGSPRLCIEIERAQNRSDR